MLSEEMSIVTDAYAALEVEIVPLELVIFEEAESVIRIIIGGLAMYQVGSRVRFKTVENFANFRDIHHLFVHS